MKVLLLGEYSNVHWTLAQGLRALGHSVTVASDGDSWKNYPRDIDLHRKSTGKTDTLDFLFRVARALPFMRGYDVVQLINPVFLELCPERLLPIYRFLRPPQPESISRGIRHGLLLGKGRTGLPDVSLL